MFRPKPYCVLLIAGLICFHELSAQNSGEEDQQLSGHQAGLEKLPLTDSSGPAKPLFSLRDIIISGNKKTRAEIILREIPFRRGDQFPLSELVNKFEIARRQLMNTTLFLEVVVALRSFEGSYVDVNVVVTERWYLFPFPYFKPVDRNLNQWMVEQKGSMDRVNYGIKLNHNNTTGRNDKLRLYIISGYTRQLSLGYDRLYIDKNLKWGLNFGLAMGKNREVNYNTINDKQVFLKDNHQYIRKYFNVNAEVSYRKAIKTRHRFGIAFTMEEVKDTIVALNPAYFKSGVNRIRFPELYYNMTYFDVDYIPYPTKGYAFQLAFSKRGFSRIVNLWQFSANGSASWHLTPRVFLSLKAFGALKLPFSQPYFNQRLLGYSDVFIQGYEYYVVDGVAGGYLKTTITRELVNFRIKVPPHKGKERPQIPFRIFGKIFGNTGYVYNPQPGDNSLSNKLLSSGGVGIDILTYYDFTLKLEWTFNQLGQNGLFLHNRSMF